MDSGMEGQIIYVPMGELKDYAYSRQTLNEYETQEVNRGFLSVTDSPDRKKIILDILSSADYYAADIRGFLYDNGQFLGHLHYIADANALKESVSGLWVKIGDGYEIKGLVYENNKPYSGFLIRLGLQVELATPIKAIKVSKPTAQLKKKSRETPKVITQTKELEMPVLNEDLFELFLSKAAKKKKQKARISYDLYKHAISWKAKPETTEDLLLAMCVAYAWMPTMLDVYIADKKELKKLLQAVKGLGTIRSVADFDKNNGKIQKWLLELIPAINNSVVGTSKVLHIFYPDYIPIIDTNVLKGWKIMVGKYYKKNPELQLPVGIPSVTSRQVNTYLKYWRTLLVMMENTKTKSVRMLEEPLYWIGMK